jgi:hypothetical protein
MGAHVGRDTTIEFAIAAEDASVGSLTWLELGMSRDKNIDDSWETADVTGDKSPDFTKQYLVTFKDVAVSISGVSYGDAVHNQLVLKAHIASPPESTGYQPKLWLRLTTPTHQRVGPAIGTKMSEAEPYADGATWSMEFMSNGAFTFVIL